MTCHLFLLTAQAIRRPAKWFSGYFDWLAKKNPRPRQTRAASESEGDSICLWVLDRKRRRFPPVMFRLFRLPDLNNPVLFEKQSGKRCPSSPLGGDVF